MADDNELRLVSRIIRTRDITPVLQRGVNEDYFTNEEARTLFGFVKRHYDKYGEVPTATTVKDNYRNATLYRVEENVDYFIDQLLEYRKWQRLGEATRQALTAVGDGDPELLYAAMAEAVREVDTYGAAKARHLDATGDALQRWDTYLEREARGTSMIGIPSGFPTIDEATAGFQSGQLVTLVAPPKTGKSTCLLRIAANVHRLGYVPLFQSFEMSNTEQSYRYDAMRAGVSHARLLRGTLRADERERLHKTLLRMPDETRFPMLDAAEGMTLASVRALIDTHKPDIVFIDGAYLMFDEITGERNTPQALTNITRGAKAIAQQAKLPIIISTQALEWKMRGNRVRADSIGYSSSFFQDSDVLLGLERMPEEDNDDETRVLKVLASRNCGPAQTDLDWIWENSTFVERGAA